jgi:raffinose/stachyose/melibiose transport system permease protein
MTAIATPTRLTEPARPEQAATASTPRRRRPRPPAIGVHVALLVFVVTSLGPIVVVVVNSFKTTKGIFGSPFSLPDSTTFSLEGYRNVLERGEFVNNYRNSVVVTGATMALTLLFATLAAFALVEYKVKLAPILSGVFIVGIMLPIRLGTVPILEMMVNLHLVDTLIALVLVYTAMSIPIAVALMMTYFRTVPAELKEAARLDGAGELRALGLVLPLVRPGLAAVASITMLPVWNDLWFPLILAPSRNNQTVTLGVQQFAGQFQNDYPALLAALTLGAIPLVVLFCVFSRQFIAGLSAGYGK